MFGIPGTKLDPSTAGKNGDSAIPREIDEITEALELFAEHVRKVEGQGEVVRISETNIVNKVIVHDWGRRFRSLLGKATIDKQTYKV